MKDFLKRIQKGHIVFAVGLLGVLVELALHVFTGIKVDTALILIFSGMMGLPKVLSTVVNGNGNNNKK